MYGVPMDVWALFAGIATIVVGGLAFLAWSQRPRPEAPVVNSALLRAEAAELARHAAAAREAAGRAAAHAVEARTRASAAAGARDLAWRAQEQAHRAYVAARRDAQAARVGLPAGGGGGGGDPAISRAALSAYRRGDITVEQLRAVWQRVDGWGPAQDALERAAILAAAGEREACRAYERAAALARRAERDAYVAEVAATALADEAVESTAEAHRALLLSQAAAPARRWPTPPAGRA